MATAARCTRCRPCGLQAREKLDVTTVIFANRSYAILNIELARVGAGNPGPKALSMLDLHNPELDWTKLATAWASKPAAPPPSRISKASSPTR